ncbi:MAG: DUF433 domain-containing protein [Chloroherpetonaceae bacterium]|nr:DUF433 domain-containing protein [Chloroherpetonaceae bacterium]
MNWKERVSSNPTICQGAVVIKGTSIMVSVILDCLSSGMSVDEILKEYPSIKKEDLQVLINYSVSSN